MPPLRIMHICHSLNTGGLERIIVEMVRHGPEHGFVCAVATLGQGGDLTGAVEEAGGPWFSLGKKAGLDWTIIPRLKQVAKQWQADVLHAHNEGAALYAGLAGHQSSLPVLCTRHGLSFGAGPKGRWLRRIAGLLCRKTVCVGRDVFRFACEEDRLPSSRLTIIYNGVDTKGFQPDVAARDRWRGELGLSVDARAVVSVGRLVPEKNYGLLIEALAKLGGAAATSKLILVGDGQQLPHLSAKAEDLGLRERVMLLGARKEIAGLLNAADLFALSSISEGIPMALLEAMACGLPAVVTDVGGNSEVVEDGRNGLLVRSREPEDFAMAMSTVLSDRQSAREMGQKGRARVLERFSLESMLSGYAGMYRKMVSREP